MIPFMISLISILLIGVLFAVKFIETQQGRRLFLENYREVLNNKIKHWDSLCTSKCTFKEIMALLKRWSNMFAHKFATLTAGIAKRVEWRARSVAHKSAKAGADDVATRKNPFLDDVRQHKESLDTQKVAEETKL